MRLEILREHRTIRVRIVSSDDHQPVQIEGDAVGHRIRELLRLFNLVSARPDHVESATVAVVVHHLVGYDAILPVVNTYRGRGWEGVEGL